MHQIRVIEQNGEPWFVGKDVAEALGYKEPTKAARERVEAEDRGVSILDTPGGKQEMTIINESGLYILTYPPPLCNCRFYTCRCRGPFFPTLSKFFKKGGELFYFENTKKIGIAGM